MIADLHVVDRRALRDAAHQRLSESLTTEPGSADADEDLLDPHEEVTTSDTAAVQWWTGPTTGTWPQLARALRLDSVALDATNEYPHRVRARWSVTVTDIDLLRTEASGPGDADETFPDLWNRAADPSAPLAELPGVTRRPVPVESSGATDACGGVDDTSAADGRRADSRHGPAGSDTSATWPQRRSIAIRPHRPSAPRCGERRSRAR